MTTQEQVVHCALPSCPNTITHRPSDRRKREYCSNACRQKAHRLRQRPAIERNGTGVTISSYDQIIMVLDELTTDQLVSLQDRIAVRLQQRAKPQPNAVSAVPVAPFLYFRKGTGVVHLAVSRNVSICGRTTQDMTAVEPDDITRICQRCAKVRDRGTWWAGWREAFGDSNETV